MLRHALRTSSLRFGAFGSRRLPWQTVYITTKQVTRPKDIREYSSKASTALHPATAPLGVNISLVDLGKEAVNITFDNGTTSEFPFVWLRDNCQCSSCYSPSSFSRELLLENLNIDEYPSSVKGAGTPSLHLTWSDGHESEYNADWLHQRAFTPLSQNNYSRFHVLKQVPWGAGHELDRFTFEEVKTDDRRLLEWLVTMEKKGATLVTNMPEDLGVLRFIEHIAFVKKTHYGEEFHVENRPAPNNLAYTGSKLGLHTDIPFYNHTPGMILLQCVKQHEGTGAETQVSDGHFAAEYLKQHHPEAHRILCSVPIYFWDKGTADVPTESARFYKVIKCPSLQYNSDGRLVSVRINNMVRDSYLDVPAQDVKPFYAALRLFHDVMLANSVTYKMKEGDMIALDNHRCQHGRMGFEAKSVRHLVAAYLDHDEARCRRRQLQEDLGVFDLE